MNNPSLTNEKQSLNDAQIKAVDHDSNHLLIVAGPGTGKTHTLVHRIASFAQKLVQDQRVLAITFTRKAAFEMEERLVKLLLQLKKKVFVGTFHSFCFALLKEYREQSGITKDFQLADEMITEEAAKSLWPSLNKKERREILNKISWAKAVELGRNDFKEMERYNRHLRELDYLDYDDVILLAVKLLEEGSIRQQIQRRYPFVFVDEYQDINPTQHKLLKLLVGKDSLITAIGDPLQAIYGFRGSDTRFFQSFREDFNGAEIVYLSDNYRSGETIISASSQVMDAIQADVPPLTATLYEEGDLIVRRCRTEKAEAEYVVHQIEKLVGGTSMFSQDSARVAAHEEGGVSFGDIAVFYRLNAQAAPLKEAFERSGIPYHICVKEKGEDDVCPPRGLDVNIEAENVSLMSLHAAKGLEFAAVFIIGCEENILPLSLSGLKSDLEEERRLFYVGMTRAKQRLYLTHADRRFLYGQAMHNKISRFVLDIEEKLKQFDKRQDRKKEKKEKQMNLF